ncbi:sigma-70 family RNA polymerase sigma factor [Streptacidiphilus sp. 4-A2]|nr:sigma-70 family RNA polymerase sigma factor [Streptacidiphilus sp. 4-A2]
MSRTDHNGEFSEFATTRTPWLRRVAYLLSNDWHQADDLTQATITKLYLHWPRIRTMENPDGYARTTLVNTFLAERRSPWRRVLLRNHGDQAAAATDLDAALDLRQALAALPNRQRATVVLRYYCDLTVEQTAEALNCSTGTVKSQTARAWTPCGEPWQPAGPRPKRPRAQRHDPRRVHPAGTGRPSHPRAQPACARSRCSAEHRRHRPGRPHGQPPPAPPAGPQSRHRSGADRRRRGGRDPAPRPAARHRPVASRPVRPARPADREPASHLAAAGIQHRQRLQRRVRPGYVPGRDVSPAPRPRHPVGSPGRAGVRLSEGRESGRQRRQRPLLQVPDRRPRDRRASRVLDVAARRQGRQHRPAPLADPRRPLGRDQVSVLESEVGDDRPGADGEGSGLRGRPDADAVLRPGAPCRDQLPDGAGAAARLRSTGTGLLVQRGGLQPEGLQLRGVGQQLAEQPGELRPELQRDRGGTGLLQPEPGRLLRPGVGVPRPGAVRDPRSRWRTGPPAPGAPARPEPRRLDHRRGALTARRRPPGGGAAGRRGGRARGGGHSPGLVPGCGSTWSRPPRARHRDDQVDDGSLTSE